MIVTISIFTLILSLVTDFLLWRRMMAVGLNKRLVYTFMGIATAMYLFLAAVMVGYSQAASHSMYVIASMVLYIFMLVQFPKITYLLLSLLGRLSHRKTIRTLFDYVGLLGALVCTVTLVTGAIEGRNHIETKHVPIECRTLPESFDNYRIALFADVHLGSLSNRERFLERVVDTINSFKPDAIIFAGDMVNINYLEFDTGIHRILARMDSNDGVFTVLGNHDLGTYIYDKEQIPPERNVSRLVECQQHLGWTVLRNESRFVTRGTDSIAITGIEFPKGLGHGSGNLDIDTRQLRSVFDQLPPQTFDIAITHAPQLWEPIMEFSQAAVTLAGHTHALQMKLSVLGHEYSIARLLYQHWGGLYREGERYLYVNSGLGVAMLPVRIGVPPEITLITLTK